MYNNIAMLSYKAHKLRNKSGKIPCEICKNCDFLEVHHIRGRKIPNPNRPANICSLCGSCHLNLHYGTLIIEGWISTTSGMTLIWHTKEQPSLTGDDAKPHKIV